MQFLLGGSGYPPAPTLWRFENSEGVLERRSDRMGSCVLPVGSYAVYADDSPSVAVDTGVRVEVDKTRIVWVTRKGELLIAVLDRDGKPVENARARRVWDARGEGAWWDRSYGIPVVATQNGSIRFQDFAVPGTLFVDAPGMIPQMVPVSSLGETMKITLLEARSAADRILRVEDSAGNPIEGAEVVSEAGPIPSYSDASGNLHLPAWGELGAIKVTAPGYFPAFTTDSESPPAVVVLTKVGTLRIKVVRQDGRPTRGSILLIEAKRNGQDAGQIWRPPTPQVVDAAGEWTGEIPRWQALGIDVVCPDGWSAHVDYRGPEREPGKPHRIVVGDGPLHRVHLAPEVEEVRAVASFSGGGEIVLQSNRPGWFGVPARPRLSGMTFQAESFVPIQVRPTPGLSASLGGGLLELQLHPEEYCQVEVRDREGLGVPGMIVTLLGRDSSRMPGSALRGYRSTNHPAWIEQVASRVDGVTDARGSCRLGGLAQGEYNVLVGMGGMALAHRDSLVGKRASVVSVGGGEPVHYVEVDRPILLHLEVLDSISNSPVDSHEICGADDTQLLPPRRGYVSEFWVGLGAEGIRVRAPGYGSVTVSLPASLERGEWLVRRRVLLSPSPAVQQLQVIGLPPELSSRPLFLQCFDATGVRIWFGQVLLDPDGRAELHIPVSRTATLTVEELDGWTFKAIDDSLEPDGACTFAAVDAGVHSSQ